MSDPPITHFTASGMPDSVWWNHLWPDPHGLVRRLGFGKGQHVVDLCCGNGLFTLALLAAGCRVEAVDCDKTILDQASDRAVEAGYVKIVWHLADARCIEDICRRPVDAVLIANTFHGIENPTDFCRALHRILKPRGRLVVVNWHARPREETIVLGQPRGPRSELRLSPQRTCQIIEPAGMTLDNVVDIQPYHYGAVFIRR